ncbi:glycosyl transferase family 1 [Mucilaginibacter frigoritolerans]|uniref:Glycosyl transferase family 1 n=1 Tax=Mucilaginibacter frigoritolerans TaxID=652788 RepID=A0A562U4U9_9SPHI|nr:glycosyltransferase family 4 protein [Mucilaginibacter frigoritolerans]TWJ00798.1 glycosyl transferase family 1 [Mucilaginibacter frigoritolerans]
MKIVQSTWVRYHHMDLARELYQMGNLKQIFTSLPWWKAKKESNEQEIPRDLISCNFLFEGIRRVGHKLPFYTNTMDDEIAVLNTKFYSRWVGRNLPECDAYMGISGSGLHAGRVAKSRGAGYIMDRGSTQIRHADISLNDEHKRWNMPYRSVHPWLIENEEAEANEATLITVASHFVKQTFIDQGTDANKIRVVPYGVSLKEFFPTGAPIDNTFRLVFVGQFSLRKGVPYLLEAFKAFDHPNKELIVVGSVADDIKPLINSIGTDHVTFVGMVPRASVKQYLSSAHALVLPSIEEGLALVQIQAMACGCPIIATPNTGSETLFENGHEGLIVPARNPQALTEAFTKLADDENMRKGMSVACLEKVKALGGWQTYAKQIVAVAEEAKNIASK